MMQLYILENGNPQVCCCLQAYEIFSECSIYRNKCTYITTLLLINIVTIKKVLEAHNMEITY